MRQRRKAVFVELSDAGKVVRIFRNSKAAAKSQARVAEMPRRDAVHEIRQQVYQRADGFCERCGQRASRASGEMHETVPRGKGGEVSLENCEWLCHDCHTGKPDSAHGNRRTRFGEVQCSIAANTESIAPKVTASPQSTAVAVRGQSA